MEGFTDTTRAWFQANFDAPTPVQERGWAAIRSGRNALLVAPTGSGKTLAAFLAGIDRLSRLEPDAPPGVRIVYVSPLKALVHDVERNLRAPLSGIRALRSTESRDLCVDVRTGDTPQRERQRQSREPGEILVTTPESLFLILGSRQRETLRTVHTVIIDEIHALAPTKRGAHLALSLERLAELADADPQRIGLSATVRPLDVVAAFLGGDRDVELIDESEPPRLSLSVRVPVPDMENVPPPIAKTDEGGSVLGEVMTNTHGGPTSDRGIWTALYPELVDAIREHNSTILFVNSRGLCERLAQRLNAMAGEDLVLAHHGSVSHEKRAQIEDALKSGRLKGIVATSSLELGIDMGAVDLVLLVESPGSVARGLQRAGRAGHQVGETSVARIYPKFKGDLLECAVVSRCMQVGRIEAIETPRNCLDVLAQQLVAMVCDAERTVDELEAIVRRAHPYRELVPEALVAVLDMLSGRYPSHDFADLRPRINWDRTRGVLTARPGAAMVSRMNAGTIPDRGAFGVYLGEDGPRVGELDEEMVFESRSGDLILLGASTWRVESITRDRVIVSPAPGEPGRLPFWKGDGPGRPIELGRELGAFVRELGERTEEDARAYLSNETALDALAAENLAAYVHEQKRHVGSLPTDRAITIERFRDELGDWRICILSPFGSRVHAPWAIALEQRLADRTDMDVQLLYSDDGIVLRFADVEDLPLVSELIPEPEELEDLVTRKLGGTSLFATLFRENAVRSLLVTRRRPEQRSPLWAQRIKARNLLATVQRFPSFPVVLETYRQALRDVFDLGGLEDLLRKIRSREVVVHEVETRSASPFARSLVFAYVAAYLYDGDSPAAERRAQALTLDRGLLRELLGQAELRELLDLDVIEELEAELQGTHEERRARDRDEVLDLLRRVGDLSEDEVARRAVEDPLPWLEHLEGERRAARVRIAGEERWIAAEEAGLYRDALGCNPPSGLPADFLDERAGAFEDLLRRFARRRGPFVTTDVAGRYGLPPAQVEPALRALEVGAILVHGELRPGGHTLEWCDADILRRIKRRTLARLRDEVAAVDEGTLARFLPRWQGVASDPPRLEDVVAQLEGLALPWSEWTNEVLPARIPGFTLEMLDLASAQGQVVWIGRGAQGARDGRLALYRRDNVALLVEPSAELEPSSEVHATILEHLDRRGASFLTQIERAVHEVHEGLSRTDFEAALWDLVWDGEITNDTFQPLRALAKSPASRGRSARSAGWVAGGRWSRVRELLVEGTNSTERSLARARMLLARYGVVSRESARHEELPSGFGAVYRVLRSMEDAGQVRRGYFVEGLSGAQFAEPGAIDRLRAARIDEDAGEPEVLVLSAVDPANPWGALLAWPELTVEEVARPRRVSGARVVLVNGRPVFYVPQNGKHLVSFRPARPGSAELEHGLRALSRLRRRGSRKSILIETVDGEPAGTWVHAALFETCGFVRDYKGFLADPRSARA